MQKKDFDQKQREIDLAWQDYTATEETDADVRRKWLLFYIEHQERKCAYCHASLVIGKIPGLEDRQATIDHILPRSLAGEDTPHNTLAACAFCNGLKGSSKLGDFLANPALVKRILQASECPRHVSSDPSSKHYDSESIARGISVSIDGIEFTNIYEYCVPESWAKLSLKRTKARNGQPMTVIKKGMVSVTFLDIKNRLRAMEDSKQYVASFTQWLSDRSQPE